MTKFLAKLIVIAGLTSLCVSTFADNRMLHAGKKKDTWQNSNQWNPDDSLIKVLNYYGIDAAWTTGQAPSVNGRQFCQGNFMLETADQGQHHDLIFTNQALAEHFVRTIEEKRINTRDIIYAQKSQNGTKDNVVVGYKTDSSNNTVNGKKYEVRLLALHNPGLYNPSIVQCGNTLIHFKLDEKSNPLSDKKFVN